MKKITFILMIAFFIGACNKNNEPSTQEQLKVHYETVYKNSMANKDYATAIGALNNILIYDSTNLSYRDTLAQFYIQSGNFEAGLKYANQVLNKQPENFKLLELVGVANQQMGNLVVARQNFNSLYNASNDFKYLYQVATLDFYQGQFSKSDSLLNVLMEKNAQSENPTYIETALTNQPEKLPLDAACYIIKGFIAREQKNYNQAFIYLEKAKKIAPQSQGVEFALQQTKQYVRMMRK